VGDAVGAGPPPCERELRTQVGVRFASDEQSRRSALLNQCFGASRLGAASAWRASSGICARHGVEPDAPTSTDTVIALHTLHKDPLNLVC
jgi:hypothetical protein